eukprot:6099521-Amphidinium_carterae.2
MAGLPEGFTMLPEGQETLYPGVAVVNGAVVSTVPTPADPQYPRLKAPAPQPPQSAPRPSTAASPTIPTGPVPTGTAGQFRFLINNASSSTNGH